MSHQAHHDHDDDDDPHATFDTPGATHDPVCGHWIIPEKAHGTTTHKGATIHFCSVACHRAFGKDPEKFFPKLKTK